MALRGDPRVGVPTTLPPEDDQGVKSVCRAAISRANEDQRVVTAVAAARCEKFPTTPLATGWLARAGAHMIMAERMAAAHREVAA